jgi:hypothetical protein
MVWLYFPWELPIVTSVEMAERIAVEAFQSIGRHCSKVLHWETEVWLDRVVVYEYHYSVGRQGLAGEVLVLEMTCWVEKSPMKESLY